MSNDRCVFCNQGLRILVHGHVQPGKTLTCVWVFWFGPTLKYYLEMGFGMNVQCTTWQSKIM